MTDHIAAVRAQAKKEAERLWPSYRTVGFSGAADRQVAYVEGQVALASRLTRKNIAIALAKQKARDWDSMSGALHVAAIHAEYPNADAILALLVDDTQR